MGRAGYNTLHLRLSEKQMAAKKKKAETTAEENSKTLDIKKLVGLTEADAVAKIVAAGMKCRVRNRDGKAFIGTCDFRMDRINLSIESGKVINATIG